MHNAVLPWQVVCPSVYLSVTLRYVHTISAYGRLLHGEGCSVTLKNSCFTYFLKENKRQLGLTQPGISYISGERWWKLRTITVVKDDHGGRDWYRTHDHDAREVHACVTHHQFTLRQRKEKNIFDKNILICIYLSEQFTSRPIAVDSSFPWSSCSFRTTSAVTVKLIRDRIFSQFSVCCNAHPQP